MTAAVHSSQEIGFQTPGYVLDLVRKVGPIAYDPASAPSNPTGALDLSVQYNVENESWVSQTWTHALKGWYPVGGLSMTWPTKGLVYCNPPYGRHLSGKVDPDKILYKKVDGVKTAVGRGVGWAAKMAEHKGEGLYLVPARTETRWWRALHAWCDWLLFWSSPEHGARITFIDPATGEPAGAGAPFPACLFYKGPNEDRFIRAFYDHGTLFPSGSTWEEMDALARS